MLVERLRQHSAMSSLGARKIRSFHGSLHARAASSRAALQFATAWLRSARGSSDEPEREALGLLGLNRPVLWRSALRTCTLRIEGIKGSGR